MRWNIIVECVGEDRKRSTITLEPSNGSPGVRLRKTLGRGEAQEKYERIQECSPPERAGSNARSSATKSPDHTTAFRFKTLAVFHNAGSRGCFCFWFVRLPALFVVICFDHTQPSPLSPMASTGHPSMASLQSASSSGVVGCLNT